MNINFPKKEEGDPECQNCLRQGHWTYECKNERVYVANPSKSQILRNPKLRLPFLKDKNIPKVPRSTDFDPKRDEHYREKALRKQEKKRRKAEKKLQKLQKKARKEGEVNAEEKEDKGFKSEEVSNVSSEKRNSQKHQDKIVVEECVEYARKRSLSRSPRRRSRSLSR